MLLVLGNLNVEDLLRLDKFHHVVIQVEDEILAGFLKHLGH